MYFILGVLIITVLISVLQGNKFSLFTKERTYLLKAFLPYMIFVYHSHLFDWDFRFVGPYVVAVFFFMSGYGLETKRIMGGAEFINKSFLLSALKKLLTPLIVPIIAYLLIRLSNTSFKVVIDEDIKKYQVILPYTWFVVTLFLLYIFFYISVTVSKRIESKINIYLYSVIIGVLLFNFVGRLVGVPGFAHVTTTAFVAGILYRNYEMTLMKRYNRNINVFTFISSVIMVLLTIYIQSYIFGNNDRPLTAFVWPICFMLLYAVIPAYNPSSRFGGIVTFLASISYELYICQSIPFLILGEKNQYPPIVYILSLFFLCTVVAFGCKYLTDKIFTASAR